ncbi:MAG TPA: hypothetical protein VK985_02770 [Rariglobus sp.]|nr:hypothetical protein [Rariglobus sp.]
MLLLAVIGVGTIVFLTAFNGPRILAMGLIETKVSEAFFHTDNITSVKVYRIGKSAEVSSADTFPIIPYGSFALIEGRAEITGDQLKGFTYLWREMYPDFRRQSLCHNPVFAVEFFEGEKRVFRTSLCWHCNNFYVELLPGSATWYGFDGDSPGARRVLKYFEELIPKK